MRYTKIFATGLALTIAATSFATTAEARHRYRNHGDAFAAGVLGFTAGAFLGSAFAGPRYYYDDYEPRYYYDEPDYYYAPRAPVYYRQAPVYYRQAPPVIYREAPGYSDPCDAPTGSSKPAWAMC